MLKRPSIFRRSGRRRGNAALETILVLSFVLLPVIFGAIEYTYAFYVKNTLHAAARAAARRAILPDATPASAKAIAVQQLDAAFDQPAVQMDDFDVIFNPPTLTGASGDAISVTVTAPTWQTFGMRALGSIPFYGNAAIDADKRIEVTVVMGKE